MQLTCMGSHPDLICLVEVKYSRMVDAELNKRVRDKRPASIFHVSMIIRVRAA
jgi:hypothetical protein